MKAPHSAYALREYGVTPAELDRFEKVVHERFQKEKQAGKLMTLQEVEKALPRSRPRPRRRV